MSKYQFLYQKIGHHFQWTKNILKIVTSSLISYTQINFWVTHFTMPHFLLKDTTLDDFGLHEDSNREIVWRQRQLIPECHSGFIQKSPFSLLLWREQSTYRAQWSDHVVRGWQNYFQRILIDKIVFFYIHMVKENLHRNFIWVHSILNPLELFFYIFFKKNLDFEHFLQIICPFEHVNLVLK